MESARVIKSPHLSCKKEIAYPKMKDNPSKKKGGGGERKENKKKTEEDSTSAATCSRTIKKRPEILPTSREAQPTQKNEKNLISCGSKLSLDYDYIGQLQSSAKSTNIVSLESEMKPAFLICKSIQCHSLMGVGVAIGEPTKPGCRTCASALLSSMQHPQQCKRSSHPSTVE